MQNSHSGARCFTVSSFSLTDLSFQWTLPFSSAMPILSVIFLKTKWITFFHLTKEFIILFPRGRRSGILKCVCGMATFQKGRVCSDVLTRTRLTSKLMNKLSIHVFSFSWETHQTPTNFSEQKTQGSNKCKSSNIFMESMNISSTSDSNLTLFAFLFSLDFFKSADLTHKQAGWSLTSCFTLETQWR